jgi:hypothetical protein
LIDLKRGGKLLQIFPLGIFSHSLRQAAKTDFTNLELASRAGPKSLVPTTNPKRLTAKYYNEARTHLSLHKDAPIPRAVQTVGRTLAMPVLGGLRHQYFRA